MRRLLLLATLGAALGLAPSLSRASAPPSGAHGLVTRGPIRPVCRVDTPCDAPVPGATLTFVRSGVLRHVRTNARGRYSIALPAGKYSVRVSGARFGFLPHVVTVRTGLNSQLNIHIDTGIR